VLRAGWGVAGGVGGGGGAVALVRLLVLLLRLSTGLRFKIGFGVSTGGFGDVVIRLVFEGFRGMVSETTGVVGFEGDEGLP